MGVGPLAPGWAAGSSPRVGRSSAGLRAGQRGQESAEVPGPFLRARAAQWNPDLATWEVTRPVTQKARQQQLGPPPSAAHSAQPLSKTRAVTRGGPQRRPGEAGPAVQSPGSAPCPLGTEPGRGRGPGPSCPGLHRGPLAVAAPPRGPDQSVSSGLPLPHCGQEAARLQHGDRGPGEQLDLLSPSIGAAHGRGSRARPGDSRGRGGAGGGDAGLEGPGRRGLAGRCLSGRESRPVGLPSGWFAVRPEGPVGLSKKYPF